MLMVPCSSRKSRRAICVAWREVVACRCWEIASTTLSMEKTASRLIITWLTSSIRTRWEGLALRSWAVLVDPSARWMLELLLLARLMEEKRRMRTKLSWRRTRRFLSRSRWQTWLGVARNGITIASLSICLAEWLMIVATSRCSEILIHHHTFKKLLKSSLDSILDQHQTALSKVNSKSQSRSLLRWAKISR